MITAEVQERLMKQVERAVRPVRAGRRRKLAMREELLAHLTALYEEERDKLADDAAALAAAFDRFGDPPELTAELDASLGWRHRLDYRLERYGKWLEYWFEWRDGQPFVQFATRSLLMTTLFCSSILVLFGALLVTGVLDNDDPTRGALLVRVTIYDTLTIWGFLIAVPVAYRLLFKRHGAQRWVRLAGCFLAIGLWNTALVTFLWLSLTGSWDETLPIVARTMLVSFTLMPLLLVAISLAANHAERRLAPFKVWQQLRIEE